MKCFSLKAATLTTFLCALLHAAEPAPIASPERTAEPSTNVNVLLQPTKSPLVTFRILFLTGSAYDPVGKEGLASVCMSMLTEGTQKLDKIQYSEKLADTASNIGAYDSLAAPCKTDSYTCEIAPIAFSRKDALPIEFDFDTGWVPQNSPLQVHLWAGVYANTHVSLTGALILYVVTVTLGLLLQQFGAPGPEGYAERVIGQRRQAEHLLICGQSDQLADMSTALEVRCMSGAGNSWEIERRDLDQPAGAGHKSAVATSG